MLSSLFAESLWAAPSRLCSLAHTSYLHFPCKFSLRYSLLSCTLPVFPYFLSLLLSPRREGFQYVLFTAVPQHSEQCLAHHKTHCLPAKSKNKTPNGQFLSAPRIVILEPHHTYALPEETGPERRGSPGPQQSALHGRWQGPSEGGTDGNRCRSSLLCNHY